MKEPYIIAKGVTLAALEEEACKLAREGYVPHGPLTGVTSREFTEGNVYCQVMFLAPPPAIFNTSKFEELSDAQLQSIKDRPLPITKISLA